jgi:hypothetical protein
MDPRSESRSLQDRYAQEQQELLKLEQRVDGLRHAYEQYFIGQAKLEPQAERKALARELTQSRAAVSNRMETRFRHNTILQRFAVHAAYWDRCLRELDEVGVLRREGFGRFASPPSPAPPSAPPPEAERTVVMQNPLAAAAEQIIASTDTGTLQKLYERYLACATAAGSEPLQEDAFRDRLGRSLVALAAQNKRVDFDVRNGKVVLVARDVQ